jgi:DNA-directed RNA polymerase subunit omega
MSVAAILPLSPKAWSRGVAAGTHPQSMRADLVEKAALVITEIPTLINMVSKRVKQLTQGRPALIERKPGMREADVALQEIIEGKIKVEDPNEIL